MLCQNSRLCSLCSRQDICAFADYVKNMTRCSGFQPLCNSCRELCKVDLLYIDEFSHCTRHFVVAPQRKKSAYQIDFLTGEIFYNEK